VAIIPKSLYPNVPKLPGVPQLRRSLQFPAAPPPIIGAALALGRLAQAFFSKPEWAIYKQAPVAAQVSDDGVETVTVAAERQPVVKPDSFLEFGYRIEYSVSDYPVQDGAFNSYDKVANPFEAFVRMSKGGSKQERKAFLDSIEAIQGTLDRYDILTPEKTYIGVNVLRYELARRGNRAAYFFTEVDLYFREIRTATAVYGTVSTLPPSVIVAAKNVDAQIVQNIGNVQAQQVGDLTPEALGIPEPGL
jgi:hypothetical protein